MTAELIDLSLVGVTSRKVSNDISVDIFNEYNELCA